MCYYETNVVKLKMQDPIKIVALFKKMIWYSIRCKLLIKVCLEMFSWTNINLINLQYKIYTQLRNIINTWFVNSKIMICNKI